MVIRAQQAAISAGKSGTVPGSVVDELNKFLNPVVPWVEALHEWMNNLVVCDYSWSQRSRRFPTIYMPSMTVLPEGLEDFVAFVDVSGSMTDEMEVRINSELKYIFEELRPEKLTVVQFDVKIQDVRVFDEANGFEGIKVYGRGGTDLQCVRNWIEEHRPTAAMVLSDLECDPMPELTYDVPILWGVLEGSPDYQHTPTYGRIIHIKE
jgi:predicted metal-dependent peptidase